MNIGKKLKSCIDEALIQNWQEFVLMVVAGFFGAVFSVWIFKGLLWIAKKYYGFY
ncbi:hypothetical protein HN858_02375 [Candidatus Falkowbacteria bacterium]|jgi:hypothetical protein|nr:hypothetical protein [Candidatus Falkowbacteria bacterium]MBT5503202.1 hypothetical protein [Candidatus Falkowbacteria bacterium]MBT6573891.1 hypothetical protein [Candidatus Falkowbacteria bacterium]MBT7348502.1 hypothetical protein [Candidatus Falkowbacteria bacterium]MBT7500833.1 hypothetical protein [Candidatus Falkowbacteria bacterium]